MSFEVEISTEVEAWLLSLSPADFRQAAYAIDQLEAYGNLLRMPLSKALGDGLFELRFSCEGVARRVTYVFDPNRVVFTLTTFRKTRQSEQREISRARLAKKNRERERDQA